MHTTWRLLGHIHENKIWCFSDNISLCVLLHSFIFHMMCLDFNNWLLAQYFLFQRCSYMLMLLVSSYFSRLSLMSVMNLYNGLFLWTLWGISKTRGLRTVVWRSLAVSFILETRLVWISPLKILTAIIRSKYLLRSAVQTRLHCSRRSSYGIWPGWPVIYADPESSIQWVAMFCDCSWICWLDSLRFAFSLWFFLF